MWSSVMGTVVTCPAITLDAESPTRMTSTPPASTRLREVVVGGQHGDWLTGALHFLKGVGRDLAGLCVNGHGEPGPSWVGSDFKPPLRSGVVRHADVDGF